MSDMHVWAAEDDARRDDVADRRREAASDSDTPPDTTGLREALNDIRDRRREFQRLGADPQYLLALDDAFGLVNNRLAAHTTTPTAASLAADLRATGETDAAKRLADGLRG